MAFHYLNPGGPVLNPPRQRHQCIACQAMLTDPIALPPKKDAAGGPATVGLEFLDKVIVVTETQFQSSKSSTIHNNLWGTDYAGDLVSAFAHGTAAVPEATVTSGIDIYSNTPGLSHPVGAKWDPSCHDLTYRFTFPDSSEASDDFEASNALLLIIESVIKESIGVLIGQAGSSSTTCPPISFSKSIDFNATDKNVEVLGIPLSVNELGAAFGKVTVTGSLIVKCRKTGANSIVADSVTFSGSFDDVYDFAYGTGGPAREAAMVQAGHATLAKAPEPNSGKVFFTRLEFSGSKDIGKTFSNP